jgi:hypothetical protein
VPCSTTLPEPPGHGRSTSARHRRDKGSERGKGTPEADAGQASRGQVQAGRRPACQPLTSRLRRPCLTYQPPAGPAPSKRGRDLITRSSPTGAAERPVLHAQDKDTRSTADAPCRTPLCTFVRAGGLLFPAAGHCRLAGRARQGRPFGRRCAAGLRPVLDGLPARPGRQQCGKGQERDLPGWPVAS